ncbi:MAG: GxxExxY protein [Phycisphaerales bacterium]|nr:GxxExxY protein [Planctomycetota bacterium]MCH8510004.1 GxxExxY protein [Phycisphaerales bacterium]
MHTRLDKSDLPDWIEEVGRGVLGAAIEVHRELGPGLLESVYEHALLHEFGLRGIRAVQQAPIDVLYKGVSIQGQRIDLLVEGLVVVELKSITQIQDVHKAQLLSYLRAGDFPLGYLINFNMKLAKDGIHRVYNERYSETPSRPSRSSR